MYKRQPLTLSLKIAEKYVEKDSRETAIGDSKWQKDADPQKWPTTEIYPGSSMTFYSRRTSGRLVVRDVYKRQAIQHKLPKRYHHTKKSVLSVSLLLNLHNQ